LNRRFGKCEFGKSIFTRGIQTIVTNTTEFGKKMTKGYFNLAKRLGSEFRTLTSAKEIENERRKFDEN
jgi:hypothetical protein